MTPEQKVSLVEGVKDTYGLNRSLAAAGLPKRPSTIIRTTKLTTKRSTGT